MLTRPRTLPVGFAASLMAAMLLSLPEAASAQRSGVRSGVIGSPPIDGVRSGVIGGGYRGAPIGKARTEGLGLSVLKPMHCLDRSTVGQGLLIDVTPSPD
jgi:hypothetical protein